MYLSGFHSMTLANARRIMREGRFDCSEDSANRLGPGVYFYTDIPDACAWRDAEVILHSIIHLEDDQLYDFDTAYGRYVFQLISEWLDNENRKLGLKESSNQRKNNQVTIAQILHSMYPNIKTFAASFHVGLKPQTIFDSRP